MGTWGANIYQDDTTNEVRTYYIDLLHKGATGSNATKATIDRFDALINDEEDGVLFWIALADTQWDYGRLEKAVKEKALICIKKELASTRWTDADKIKKRKTVLEGLLKKLLRPQPAEKKINTYKLFNCTWNKGDVFAYRFSGTYAEKKNMKGRYVYFVVVDKMTWHPGHIIPVVYVYWIVSDSIMTLEEVVKNQLLPQFYLPSVYERDKSIKKLFRLSIITKSAKTIPDKQLKFLGNYIVNNVEGEDLSPFSVTWKDFEQYLIDDIAAWT